MRISSVKIKHTESVDSIKTSNVLLFKNINPKIIETKPITNTIITPPTSLNEISFITNILANP